MKRFIILFAFILICSIASADVFVSYDNSTKEIVSMDKRKDLVMQDGWTRVELPGKLKDYELQYAPTYYKYENGRFIVNIKKLSDEAIAAEQVFIKQKFEQQVFTELFTKYKELANYYLIISRCIDYNNEQGWSTLKAYIDGLLVDKSISQEAYDDFIKVLKDNYIEL